jgi:hypothetical protein
MCSSGVLSGLIGTTCDIGNIQFNFTNLGTTGNSYPASDFEFTVLSNGFSIGFLSGDGGPQTLNGPPEPNQAQNNVILDYNWSIVGTGWMTGAGVSGGTLSVSGSSGLAIADYENELFNASNTLDAKIVKCESAGFSCNSNNQNTFLAGGPFSSGQGYAIVYALQASADTAKWADNGPTNFTFAVPESSALCLLGVALGCFGIARLRLRH